MAHYTSENSPKHCYYKSGRLVSLHKIMGTHKKIAENSTIILGSALLPQPLHTTKLLWEMMNNPAVGWASSCTGTKRANAKGMEDSQDQHEGMHFKHVFKKLEIKNLMLWHCCPALRSHTCSLPVGQQQSISNTSPMLTLKSHTGAQQWGLLGWAGELPELGQSHKQMCSEPKPSLIWYNSWPTFQLHPTLQGSPKIRQWWVGVGCLLTRDGHPKTWSLKTIMQS